MSNRDHIFMARAIEEAKVAADHGEVPVGAVIVCNEQIIATAHNLRESTQSPCAHAEILAIEAAAKKLLSWRLIDCELFVTLEPCLMCAGAIVHARLKRVVYAASDPKGGALGSIIDIQKALPLNHKFTVDTGLLASESARMLRNFFQARRIQN